jgi:Amt family ammonium transporter
MMTPFKLVSKTPVAALMAALLFGSIAVPDNYAQESAPAPAAEAPAAPAAETPAPAPAAAPAEEAAADESAEKLAEFQALLDEQGDYKEPFDFFALSMVWTLVCATYVFIMHLGFSCVEAGLTQSKNTVNVIFKNVFILAMGLLTYAAVGFNTHYPGDFNGFFKLGGPIGDLNADGGATFGYGGLSLAMTGFGDFIFQAMFAATAATIVSGAVAERVKFGAFLIFATLLVAFAYPVVGSWHWGGGWLSAKGFKDFAGSAVVHGFGGMAALACVIVLGPRRGKYVDGKIRPILGHSMPLATIGVFLLFFGWFGFNGGSVLSASPGPIGLVVTTTALGGAAGALACMIVSWIVLKKPDLSMALNGILGGLVGVTANADIITPWGAVIIGAIAGVVVFFSIIILDKIKIDDPVGAISVHGTCGIWGILAAYFFDTTGEVNLGVQITGIVAVYATAFIFSIVVFGLIKLVMGVRVSAEEEAEGLDIGEHGAVAYDIPPAK